MIREGETEVPTLEFSPATTTYSCTTRTHKRTHKKKKKMRKKGCIWMGGYYGFCSLLPSLSEHPRITFIPVLPFAFVLPALTHLLPGNLIFLLPSILFFALFLPSFSFFIDPFSPSKLDVIIILFPPF